MIETRYEELHELIEKGKRAKAYAWEHYEELAAREAVYTLYGPSSVYMGAASPSHLIQANVRKLTHKTRRNQYLKYELDQDYRVIRVISKNPHKYWDYIHHVFELDGVTYGCPFKVIEKRFADTCIEAIYISEGKPRYYAQTTENSIFCEFYEYPTEDSRRNTGYLYSKKCQTTSYQMKPNWDAPFGAPDSPVSVHCYESTPWDLDFSKYFQ